MASAKWELIDWDGNRALGYKCYRKTFADGHISVGVGDFTNITYSFGPNSDRSGSSTRKRVREGYVLTEQEAMQLIDEGKTL